MMKWLKAHWLEALLLFVAGGLFWVPVLMGLKSLWKKGQSLIGDGSKETTTTGGTPADQTAGEKLAG